MPPSFTMIVTVVTAAVILGTIAVLTGIVYLLRYLSYRKGTRGKNLVDTTLKKFGIIRNYKILRDVHLSVGGREARIDHMMIGFFGIIFVSSVNDTAEYYGEAKDTAWTKVSGKNSVKREKIENLIQINLRNIDVVREIFAKHNVFNIKMESVVVFCGNRKKTIIGITGSPTLMTFKKFKGYIRKAKFEKDNDVDVPELYRLVTERKV